MKSDKNFEKVSFVEVNVNKIGQRLDNFLITLLKNVPKSKVYRIIRKGEVRINKKRVKPDYKLKLHDIIRIPPIVVKLQQTPLISSSVEKEVKSAIVFETEDFLLLNKPVGLAVHGGSGLHNDIINTLRSLLKSDAYLELIHRLDKETSGCLLIAKTGAFLRKAQEAWQTNQIQKEYHCVLKGHWPQNLGKVDFPLKKNVVRSQERMVVVDYESGKSAVSHFQLIKHYDNTSLVKVLLETGRTHQIRVHAAHSGYPIVGDLKYGDKTFNRNFAAKRMYLHASKLILPKDLYEPQVLEASLPKDFYRSQL